MQTRLKYWSGDHMGYLDALNALLSKCRTKARSAPPGDTTTISMWKERGARICLIIASQMVEMKVSYAPCLCDQAIEEAVI
jgi:trafficking protein particle complex subunit 12